MFQEKATQWRHKWYITTVLTAWVGTPYALCCWMIPCYVCVRLCAPVVLHSPLLPNTILSWSAGPLQGRRMTARLWSAIGWDGHPSQHLPITLPWRRVGSVWVMAGVWRSVARRKLCVNMGGERCQWPGGKGARDSVGKCEGETFATWMKESLTGSKGHLEVCWAIYVYRWACASVYMETYYACVYVCIIMFFHVCTVRSIECSVKGAICV